MSAASRSAGPDQVRRLLADGQYPPVVYWPGRERAARQVAAVVADLAPSPDEELAAGLTPSPILERRHPVSMCDVLRPSDLLPHLKPCSFRTAYPDGDDLFDRQPLVSMTRS